MSETFRAGLSMLYNLARLSRELGPHSAEAVAIVAKVDTNG